MFQYGWHSVKGNRAAIMFTFPQQPTGLRLRARYIRRCARDQYCLPFPAMEFPKNIKCFSLYIS
jgi:hypothetical protein